MRISWCTCALAAGLPSCLSFGEGDAKIPGEELGTYQVVASLEESSCGPGALGSSNEWQFPVRLSRDSDEIFWLNGKEVIFGRIGDDGVSFRFDTQVTVEITEPRGAFSGCTVTRSDTANGELAGPGPDVPSFDGTLRYAFAAAEGSDCSDLAAAADGLPTLPCQMAYAMSGTRAAEPTE